MQIPFTFRRELIPHHIVTSLSESLLHQQLLKKSSPIDYPHYEELKAGSAAAKRITDKINEAQRRAENTQTVHNLASRVDDWKGHHVSQFGELLLEDIFIVTKSEVDREYHVFLFERIILCCKEDTSIGHKKAGKNGSILKKPHANGMPPNGPGSSKKKMTPLLLKGRIYLNNVTEARVVSPGTFISLTLVFLSESG
jgi:cell division control protein 24